jgi:hypothetical protein
MRAELKSLGQVELRRAYLRAPEHETNAKDRGGEDSSAAIELPDLLVVGDMIALFRGQHISGHAGLADDLKPRRVH